MAQEKTIHLAFAYAFLYRTNIEVFCEALCRAQTLKLLVVVWLICSSQGGRKQIFYGEARLSS